MASIVAPLCPSRRRPSHARPAGAAHEPHGARHRRRRLHRLEPRARRCSSAATTCACSTTSRPATASNLDGLDVEVVEGELRSYERVHNAVRGVEVVFHLGALGSVPRSVQDPLTSNAVNVDGTLNVLLAARDEGVRRVVYASSSSVYGSAARAAADGDDGRPTRSRRTASRSSPRSATASASAGSTTRSRRSYSATSTSSARGRARARSTRPSCRSSSPRSRAGEPVTIHGDGEQSRDFTYVSNVVDANLARGRRRRCERTHLQRRRRARRRASTSSRRPIGASARQARRAAGMRRRARVTSGTRGPTSPQAERGARLTSRPSASRMA